MLAHFVYNGLYPVGKRFGLGLSVGLGIDAYDRLCVRFAQVHPAFGEIDFHTVDIGYPLAGEAVLDSREYRVDINVGRELYLCLVYFVCGKPGTYLADLLARFGEHGEE